LIGLWTKPLPASDADALAAFRAAYADTVRVNGVDTPLAELVRRARMLQQSFADLKLELIERIETPRHLVIVFWQRGRQVGTVETPIGEIEATGREVQIQTIEVLTLRDRRITDVWVVADNLTLALQLGALV
jgi:predicted ester cyclase